MSSLKTPYLLLIPVDGGKLFGYYRLTGQDPGDVLQLDETSGKWSVGPGFLQTTFAQLYAHQGSTLPSRPCVSGLQLIRTSEGAMTLGGRNLPVAQLYRRVSGALVRGEVAPGERVRIGVMLHTTAGTDTPFECQATADERGHFEIRFPYPSTGSKGLERRSPVLLIVGIPSANNPPIPIEIPQSAVDEGNVVELIL